MLCVWGSVGLFLSEHLYGIYDKTSCYEGSTRHVRVLGVRDQDSKVQVLGCTL